MPDLIGLKNAKKVQLCVASIPFHGPEGQSCQADCSEGKEKLSPQHHPGVPRRSRRPCSREKGHSSVDVHVLTCTVPWAQP